MCAIAHNLVHIRKVHYIGTQQGIYELHKLVEEVSRCEEKKRIAWINMSNSILKGNTVNHDSTPLVPYGRCDVLVFDSQSKRSDDICTVRYGTVLYGTQVKDDSRVAPYNTVPYGTVGTRNSTYYTM